MKTLISFRLRKDLDADLIGLNIEEDKLPELCRNGLRLMLGIRTSRHMEMKENPLLIPSQSQGIRRSIPPADLGQKEKTAQSPQRPAVFLPQQMGKS